MPGEGGRNATIVLRDLLKSRVTWAPLVVKLRADGRSCVSWAPAVYASCKDALGGRRSALELYAAHAQHSSAAKRRAKITAKTPAPGSLLHALCPTKRAAKVRERIFKFAMQRQQRGVENRRFSSVGAALCLYAALRSVSDEWLNCSRNCWAPFDGRRQCHLQKVDPTNRRKHARLPAHLEVQQARAGRW